jgi:predicted transposase YbfD/YdcC
MFANVVPYFDSLDDPRRDNANKLHLLHDILFVVLCAILSGVEDWLGMETWAEDHLEWLRKYVDLAHGVPSHDTLMDVLGRIDVDQFNECFQKWVETELPNLNGVHVAIDGKTLRGSRTEKGVIHMVSAFACKSRIVLTQVVCDQKSNEITAIPALLELLDLREAIVTIDAMGCQKAIAQQIIDAKGEYVLAVKENQPTLHDAIQAYWDKQIQENRLVSYTIHERGHGRSESRRYAFSADIETILKKIQWPGLLSIGMVESVRTIKDKTSTDIRYFATSLKNPTRFADAVRDHWSIENTQHHILDVQFSEDKQRTRRKRSLVHNMAIVRRAVLNLLQRNTSDKLSIRARKMRAGYSNAYRETVLFGASMV